MKVMVALRGGGKTWQCVKYLNEHPEAVLLVPDAGMRAFVIHEYPDLNPRRVYTVAMKDQLRGRSVTVVIDNLDLMLQHFVGMHPVEFVTLSGELSSSWTVDA